MNVFMDLFSASLHQHAVPLCFKAGTIIPVRKKAKVKALNDNCPVAMTSVVVTVLERLTVLTNLKSVTNSNIDPLQFAYMDNRYTDDTGALALHFVMQHIYARILFVDYIHARILFVDLQFRVQYGYPIETLPLASCICYH